MTAEVKEWPQALTNIRGRIDMPQGRLSTDGLDGELEGAPLIVRGTVDLSGGWKVVDASGEVVGLAITNALAARIRKLPDPCPTVADQIEAWDPDGFANVKFRLVLSATRYRRSGRCNRSSASSSMGGRSSATSATSGTTGERHGFPYPLQELRGTSGSRTRRPRSIGSPR